MLSDKGGFVDQNMRAYEMTEAKVVNDLCTKFQFPRATLVPNFKFDQNEEYLKHLNFKKL